MLFRDRIGVARQTMHGLVFTWALFVRLATRVAGTLTIESKRAKLGRQQSCHTQD
jgi:hypothetical protein